MAQSTETATRVTTPTTEAVAFHVGLFAVLWAGYAVLLVVLNSGFGTSLTDDAIAGLIVATPAFALTASYLAVYRRVT